MVYISTVDQNEVVLHEEEKVLDELPSNEEMMMEFGYDIKQTSLNHEVTPMK